MQREIHGNLEWLCKDEDIIFGMYCPEEYLLCTKQ